MLSFRLFESEIRWTVIDESSSFMEFKVLEVTPNLTSKFQVGKNMMDAKLMR